MQKPSIFIEPSGRQWLCEQVHISLIVWGDTVVFRGELCTVGKADLRTGFHGRTLFGDSYRGGSQLVQRAIKVI